jgi:hypothetical protein
MPGGGHTAPESDQACLPLAIEERQAGRTGLWLPVACSLEPLCDQALSDALDGSATDGAALGDALIRPRRTSGIGLQQDMGMPDLVCRRWPFPGQLGSLAAFLVRQTHDVFLVHGTLHLRVRSDLRWKKSLLTYKNNTDKVLVGQFWDNRGVSHTLKCVFTREGKSTLSP